MLNVFLPKMTGLFQQFDKLPLATRLLLQMQKIGHDYGAVFITIGLFAVAFLFSYKIKNKKNWASLCAYFKVPFLYPFLMEGEIAKFTRTMALILKSGVPIQDGLELASSVFSIDLLKAACLKVRQQMLAQGIRLSEGLKGIKVFPPFALNMIVIGEESGKLEGMLDEVSIFFEKELEQKVRIITKILEPALILIIGSIIGFIVLAFLLPIFEISTVIQ
jgi:type IV pilus assembly protein PilC